MIKGDGYRIWKSGEFTFSGVNDIPFVDMKNVEPARRSMGNAGLEPDKNLATSGALPVVLSQDECDRQMGVLLARLTKLWHTLIVATEGLSFDDLSPEEAERILPVLDSHFHSQLLPHYRSKFSQPYDSDELVFDPTLELNEQNTGSAIGFDKAEQAKTVPPQNPYPPTLSGT